MSNATPLAASLFSRQRLLAIGAIALAGAAINPTARATEVGLTTIDAPDRGPVTVFYPSASPAQDIRQGPFRLRLARDGAPAAGNRRLVVLSHGSGGSPWVHVNLATALVQAGFVVAMPEHKDDNYRHDGRPGPDSWKLRPREVSQAIDAVAADTRFAPLVDTRERVGMYGMSAGGHTALSLAGGSWSPGGFKRHCETNLDEDFQSCVGLATRLRNDAFDGIKKWVARTVIRITFDDDTPQTHQDPRIAAVVAAVPYAADFDMASLVRPAVPLALATAGRDAWLTPRFHSDRVLAACSTCVHLVDLPAAGHGAYLSPLPPGLSGLVGDMLNDPADFDRSVMAEADRRIVAWFSGILLAPQPTPQPTPQP